MATNATTPDKTINYRVYIDGDAYIGTGTVDLPEIAYQTDTLSGAGLAGEIETPVIGHIQAMSMTINWRTVNKSAVGLLKTTGTTLTLRASQQHLDNAEHSLGPRSLKIVVKTLPKKNGLGSLEMGASSGTTSEVEVTYIKIEENGEELCEIDKLNYICKIHGTDFLADVRSHLGI